MDNLKENMEESLQAAVAGGDDDADADFQLTPEQARMLLEQAGGNEGLAAALQGKLAQVIGSSSGFVESLPKPVRRRIAALQDLQTEHDELEEEYRKERAALEAKYRTLYEPFYEKRKEIVSGEVEPAVKEAEEGEEAEEDAAAEGETEEGEDVKGVPNFWLYVLRNHEVTEEQITEKDEECLKHLTDIKWEHFEGDDTKGFKLFFHFDANPFFENEVLTKTYTMIDEDDPILEHAEGTEIKWKQGKNLTVKLMKKKPKKGKAAGKTLTKSEPCESFFNFFSPPKIPEDGEELEEEEMEQLQEVMEADYEIGAAIKEKLIPHAVSWFTGEALQEDEEDDEEEDEDDDEEDDEDEEGGEGGAPAGLTDAAEKPAECKQQ